MGPEVFEDRGGAGGDLVATCYVEGEEGVGGFDVGEESGCFGHVDAESGACRISMELAGWVW